MNTASPFTKSENFKSEYSCAVVRVGELTPVEGSDFLSKTNVFGTQIIVRKDDVKEGQIMIYAANETQLNERFLSVNNLFEIGERDKNSNCDEVNKIMSQYEPVKNKILSLKEEIKRKKQKIEKLSKEISKINKKITSLTKSIAECDCEEEQTNLKNSQVNLELERKKKETYLEKLSIEVASITSEKDKLASDNKYIVDEAKKMCGFFNKYGRVKLITLKGEPSFGFLFHPDNLFKYDSTISMEDIENYVGNEFDTINGELFVKAYVPCIKEKSPKEKVSGKKGKNKKTFNRLATEFVFHYDTQQLQKSMHLLDKNSVVDITPKVHGTSAIYSKTLVKRPLKLPLIKRIANQFIDFSGLFKDFKTKDYELTYGSVYSSRRVIKNKYLSKNEEETIDIWGEFNRIIYPYLDENMTVYGEIVGYETNTKKMLQKNYDYGCDEGSNKLMIYRITTNGKEWEIPEIREWSLNLIEKMKSNNDENFNRILPIPILYHGTLSELYDNVPDDDKWCENMLTSMMNDKENLGMELLEPLCKTHKVPREGIVLRIENDAHREAFKLKCTAFLQKESKMIDDGEIDIEMVEAYS